MFGKILIVTFILSLIVAATASALPMPGPKTYSAHPAIIKMHPGPKTYGVQHDSYLDLRK